MTSDDPRTASVAEFLGQHAGTRQQIVDEHMFDPQLPRHPRTRFRLQVFAGLDLRSVAVATQTDGEGTSLTNAAERYVEAVWKRYCPDEPEPPIWIEHQLIGEQDAGCRLVTFAVAGPHALDSPPKWGPRILQEEIGRLVGSPVDIDRGRQVRREPEPEPRMVYEPFRVIRLPRPDHEADRACRPAGISWWQARLRQLAPRRGGQSCCWYHGGDWHQVSRTAIDLLGQARAAGTDENEVPHEVLRRAEQAGVADWNLQALTSLFIEPIQIEEEAPERHVNGRHRTQAMLEAGVRRTIVGYWRLPS